VLCCAADYCCDVAVLQKVTSRVVRLNPLATVFPAAVLPHVQVGSTMHATAGACDACKDDSDGDGDDGSCCGDCDDSDCSDSDAHEHHDHRHCRPPTRKPSHPHDDTSVGFVVNVNFGNDELESLHRAYINVPKALQPLMDAVMRLRVGDEVSERVLVGSVTDVHRSAAQGTVNTLIHHGCLTVVG
jgi:hypothetical protein